MEFAPIFLLLISAAISSAQLSINDLPAMMNEGIPKFMRMPDDMNRMANYMNDLRIVTIVITVTSYIGGICFVLFKCYAQSRGSSRGSSRTESRRNQRHYFDDVDPDQWELRSVRTDKKPLTPNSNPSPEFYEKPPPPPAIVTSGGKSAGLGSNLPPIDQ